MNQKINKETQEKIQELQQIEQNMQSFMIQKQNFNAQLAEIDSALKEIGKSKDMYKIIGNVMVKANKDDLEKELKQKKEMFELRIKNIEKQENKIKDKASELQKEIMKEMENKK